MCFFSYEHNAVTLLVGVGGFYMSSLHISSLGLIGGLSFSSCPPWGEGGAVVLVEGGGGPMSRLQVAQQREVLGAL